MSEDEESLITKRTFEDCLRSQERLRKKLTQLIEENRCLTDEERDDFFYELAHSTYGMGITKHFKVYIREVIDLGNVESAARWIASQTKNPVIIFRDGYPDSLPIEISKLWKRLLHELFAVFPIALERASSMSKEVDATIGGMGYEFNPNE